jgi:AcrR family transcriptional regulator
MAPPDRPYDRKRIDILKSAAAAFRRRGFHGASVAQIARALRMTKGNLYYYFRNKTEILYFCHTYSLDRLLAELHRVARAPLAPDEKLRRLIAAFVHLMIDELHGTALTMDLSPLPPRLLRRVIARRDRFDRGLRAIVQEGIAAGVFAPADVKLVTFAILGAINWIPRWFDPRGPARSDAIAEAFADYLVGGLKAGRLPTPATSRPAPPRPPARSPR